MMTSIGRDEVQRLVDEQRAIVAEVLPRPEYDWAHLPGAIHLPLKGWTIEQIEAGLDRAWPVIVYCNDYQ
jgi:rhodanese-related sulfurtransferase